MKSGTKRQLNLEEDYSKTKRPRESSQNDKSSSTPFYQKAFSSLLGVFSKFWHPALAESPIEPMPSPTPMVAESLPLEKPPSIFMPENIPDEDISVEEEDTSNSTVLPGIEDLISNFYINAQFIIDSFHLIPFIEKKYGKPLPQKEKSNLKDGVIEREKDGGMHVGRTQFYALILHQMFKKIFPEHTETSINTISQTLNLNEYEIITLTRYAILFHNCAKTEINKPFCDKESGINYAEYLESKGISTQIADIFAMALTYKDEELRYAVCLLNLTITDDKISAFDYIRKLITLSVCLDTIRYLEKFKLSHILKVLKDIPAYHPEIHNKQIEALVLAIFDLLNEQKDMMFPCEISLDNDERLATSNQNTTYLSAEKVKYEHAENVCSVIGDLMTKNPFFAEFLAAEKFACTEKARVRPGYKAYIHGTTAKTLSIFERTGMTMMGPIQMLEKFMTAPMCGELDDGIQGLFVKECKPCFGKLDAPHVAYYNLGKILEDYAAPRSDRDFNPKKEFSIALERSFGNMNKLLIALVQTKQLGIDILDAEQLREMIVNMQATHQYYYLILLLGKHIYLNFSFLDSLDKDLLEAYSEVALKELTYQNFIAKIKKRNLDIKSIYKNPGPEALANLLSLFQLDLPKIITFQNWCGVEYQFVFPTQNKTQLFTLTPHHRKGNGDYFMPKTFPGFVSFNCKGHGIADLIKHLILGSQSIDSLELMQEKFLHIADVLAKKITLFAQIAAQKNEDFQFNARQKFFLANPFPLIFISENEALLELLDLQKQEYRAKINPKIGVDITSIATETETNRLIVMKYLEDNHLYNVSVILFEDLKESKKSHQKPQSPYVHQQGSFPKLSWLSAKKAASIDAISTHPNVGKLIEKAKEYNSLKFG